MVTGLHPRCPLPPHPNPPPRRGEGRVGVIFLMSFLECLGKDLIHTRAAPIARRHKQLLGVIGF